MALRYATSPAALDGADIVIIPGSKNTLADLSYLREQGFPSALGHHVDGRRELVGICGGYQMLGRTISDPYEVEEGGTSLGLGYLSTETELTRTKCTTQVEAHSTEFFPVGRVMVRGYQIHMGVTVRANEFPCFQVRRHPSLNEEDFDGAIQKDGLVWGTYIHGVFDAPDFRRAWLNRARTKKGLPLLDIQASQSVTSRLQGELDRWADHLASHVDLSRFLR